MLISKQKKDYFDATVNRNIRDELIQAVDLLEQYPAPTQSKTSHQLRIAIDCGCGSGSNIAYLREKGFIAYGFDIEPYAIETCHQRFASDPKVYLSQASFNTFEYPKASLVVADASLFFCAPSAFTSVWKKIVAAIQPGGIFCGSFLGAEDTMASDRYDKAAYWPEVLVMNQSQVENCFTEFEMVNLVEHKTSGIAPHGEQQDWHIYSVLAIKKDSSLIGA